MGAVTVTLPLDKDIESPGNSEENEMGVAVHSQDATLEIAAKPQIASHTRKSNETPYNIAPAHRTQPESGLLKRKTVLPRAGVKKLQRNSSTTLRSLRKRWPKIFFHNRDCYDGMNLDTMESLKLGIDPLENFLTESDTSAPSFAIESIRKYLSLDGTEQPTRTARAWLDSTAEKELAQDRGTTPLTPTELERKLREQVSASPTKLHARCIDICSESTMSRGQMGRLDN